jgi:hypothetical protein
LRNSRKRRKVNSQSQEGVRYLNLKVFSERDEDVLGLLEICLIGDPGHVHGQCDGEIKGVEGCFISDDEGVFFEGEFGEVDCVFRGGEEVQKLA